MTGHMGMDGAVSIVGGGGGTGSKKEGNSDSYLYSRLGDGSGCAA